jgi:hypothetical protein
MNRETKFLNFRKNTVIISGFPGIGKSFLFNKYKNKIILDSDYSKFSWIIDGIRNPQFPDNYINHIKNNIGIVDIILVSCHETVRNALVENIINFYLVYPDKKLKDIYLNNYKNRGNNDNFINMMNKNWDSFINQLETQNSCKKIILKKDEYLKDIIENII